MLVKYQKQLNLNSVMKGRLEVVIRIVIVVSHYTYDAYIFGSAMHLIMENTDH